MRRPTQQQIDDGILDIAAGVFAQYGYEQASVQRIADAVGYSKTGLLHRFPSKDSIKVAVRQRCLAQVRGLVDSISDIPPGPDRDRATVSALVDLAMQFPGSVTLLLNAGLHQGTVGDAWGIPDARIALDEAFCVDQDTPIARQVGVVGCLGALGFGVVALREYPAHLVRDDLVSTCLAALGV